jgi:NADPH2:quinone reductase
MQWAAEGKIRPHVSHVYPLAQYRRAMLARWNGEVTGGCVMHP